MQSDDDLYEILGVDENDTFEQIKEAYRYNAHIRHPDHTTGMPERVRRKAEEELKQVNRAYEILSNPDKRRQYDYSRRTRSQTTKETGTSRANTTEKDDSRSVPFETFNENQESAQRSGKASKPRPEVYPKTVKFDNALPYV